MTDEFESMEGVDPATSPEEPQEQLTPSPTHSQQQQQQHSTADTEGDMETDLGAVPPIEGYTNSVIQWKPLN